MHPTSERRLLQAAILVGGLVPVGAGLAAVLSGPGVFDGVGLSVPADSHVRYLSGLLLGIGLAFWSAVPAIERRTRRIRLLTVIVVIGGLGRLTAIVLVGVPDLPMLLALGMELVVTPALCLWQARVARLQGHG